MFSIKKILTTILFCFLTVALFTQLAFAVAPSDEVIAKWKQDGVFEEKMEFLRDFHKRGGCAPEKNLLSQKYNSFATSTQVDTIRVLVLMVEFSDHLASGGVYTGTVADFDSILFSEGYLNPTGSMTDYYLENSYGNFHIQGEIFGWYMMPQTYDYYTNDAYGIGIDEPNSRTLVNDAITIADSDVNFSNYDFNNDDKCDGVILIHSGPGAETTSLTSDIWSHKWTIPSTRTLDGVEISAYNMNPEEYGYGAGAELSPIGVFCHEYGHFLGLPDLYDTKDTSGLSAGLGRWSIMASGNYNGDSKIPAHFDAWCKKEIGFLNLIDVTDNLYNFEIPQIETNPTAYKLSNIHSGPQEYFIVENRQKTGFDVGLPGEGILIYHIDETKYDNDDPSNYLVALEQADGVDQLALLGSRGDFGDPFPGAETNRNFHKFSLPNSNLYNGGASRISVWNISNSDSIMTADLDVDYSRPWIESSGASPFVMEDADSDGILEPGETIQFYFNIRNQMRAGENVYASLSSTNSGLQFTQNDVTILGAFNTNLFTNPSSPIEFVVQDTLTPHIDSFFLTITTDSLDASSFPVTGSDTYTETLGFEVTIGKPNILIVDADRGASLEVSMDSSLYVNRVPSDIWDINASGTPSIGDVLPYDMVLWHTGEEDTLGVEVINAADIAVMKQLMDNGINLMLSTVSGVDDIMNIDPAFLTDYFHADKNDTISFPFFYGVSGNPIGDEMKLSTLAANFYVTTTLTPSGEGMPAFLIGTDVCGVTYDGPSYKSALVTFAVEFIDDNRLAWNTKTDLIGKVVDFFGGVSTSIYDGSPYVRLPNSFELNQNYPNPFNPTTTICYTIRPTDEVGAETLLEVFNMMGQKVITLVNEAQIPGNYEIQWDGTNSANQEVASGIYFYRLSRGSESNTKKMTLLK